jgi:hypothetical protein
MNVIKIIHVRVTESMDIHQTKTTNTAEKNARNICWNSKKNRNKSLQEQDYKKTFELKWFNLI